jgi:hypothetical protein
MRQPQLPDTPGKTARFDNESVGAILRDAR